MPGRLFLKRSVADVAAALGAATDGVQDEHPRTNIAPGQELLVFDGTILTRMRWGIIPVGRVNARGRPVMDTIINARSETVFDKSAFQGVGRAVIPVDGWYEWTGKARRKTPWSFSAITGDVLYVAAITDVWAGPGGIEVPQVAAVTCDPNDDVAPIHHRMGVLLARETIDMWIHGTEADARALLRPWCEGHLQIVENPDVNWANP